MCSLINRSTLLSCGYRRRTKSIKGDSSNPSTRLGDEGSDCVSEDGTLTCFLRCFDCCLMPSFRDWSVKLFMFFSLFTRKVFSSSYCSTFSTSPYILWMSWSKAGSGRTLLLEGIWTRHVGHSFFPILMHLSMHSSQNLCRHSFTIRAFFIYPRQIAQWNSELRTLRGSSTLFNASAVSVRGARWISNKVKSGIWVNSSHLDLGLKSTCLLLMDVLREVFELMIRWRCCSNEMKECISLVTRMNGMKDEGWKISKTQLQKIASVSVVNENTNTGTTTFRNNKNWRRIYVWLAHKAGI